MSSTLYYAAAYFRISKDDANFLAEGKKESDSIRNQRALVVDYIQNQPDIILCQERIDDGYSGVTFERPAFRQMMLDVKSGAINCIIVKDLSRFGRNYIEAGRYIQKEFPHLGVRFIAINDHYDSLQAGCYDSILIPFKNLLNDSYSRDISTKVRSQLEIKRKRGDFIGAFAPYGYQKDADCKNHLVPDAKAAINVKKIFEWKIGGYSKEQIAHMLNNSEVASPAEYKKENGMQFQTGFQGKGKAKWSPLQVERILTNEVYLGHMVQGKKTRQSLKINKIVEKPKEKWERVEYTHEGIISVKDFETVQKLLRMDTRISPARQELFLLAGIVKCADCKENMVLKKVVSKGKEYHYCICSSYKQNKASCKSHIIRENYLLEVILLLLKQYLSLQNVTVEIDRSLVVRMIERIEVLEKGKIRITFCFVVPWEESI